MSGTGAEPEWLDAETGGQESIRTVSRARTTGGTRPVAILAGLALLGLLASLVIADRGDEPATPDVSEREQPADEERASPGPAVPAVADGDPTAALTAELDSLGTVFRMVLSPRTGDGSVLLTIDPDAGSSVTPLPDLSRFEFDDTGEWLAGLSVTRWGDRRRVLWAGPAGGPMEPLAFDILTFAWHADQPGVIAFTGTDRTAVSVMDLNRNEPAATFTLPVQGRIRGWGNWGFAVETSPRASTTAIVGTEGSVLIDGLPGRFRGTLHDGRIVLSGRRHMLPFAVDPSTAQITPIDGVEPSDFVWRIADAEGSDRAVAIVSHSGLEGARFDGSVYSIDAGGKLDHVGEVYAFTDVDISADGTIAIFAQQADGHRSASINGLIGDDLTVVPLSSSGGWVAAISMP